MGVEINEETKTARVVPDIVVATPKRFVVTLWDGDIYILEGYDSIDEIHEKIAGLEWVRMPNGARVKNSSISKIQEYGDYRFQTDQKGRHKKGQYLAGKNQDTWFDTTGEICQADVKSITGLITNTPQGKALPQGRA